MTDTKSISSLKGDDTLVLPEFADPPQDPIRLLGQWLESAEVLGVSEPYAFVLSTADSKGRPSSRTVLLKEVSPLGIVFGTSMFSRKGQQMAENAWVSVAFHWRETVQQVVATGRVTALDELRSDFLFADRLRSAQAATSVSHQSEALFDEVELRREVENLVMAPEAIPRPSTWRAYEIELHEIEFWHGSGDRLHRRLQYVRDDVEWTHHRLQP
jgi:dihydrophenazinedicarboxylate synthase